VVLNYQDISQEGSWIYKCFSIRSRCQRADTGMVPRLARLRAKLAAGGQAQCLGMMTFTDVTNRRTQAWIAIHYRRCRQRAPLPPIVPMVLA